MKSEQVVTIGFDLPATSRSTQLEDITSSYPVGCILQLVENALMSNKKNAPTMVMVVSPVLIQIGIRNTPKPNSNSELVVELAEREANEIAQLRTQALKK
jgi:hypothetical protein